MYTNVQLRSKMEASDAVIKVIRFDEEHSDELDAIAAEDGLFIDEPVTRIIMRFTLDDDVDIAMTYIYDEFSAMTDTIAVMTALSDDPNNYTRRRHENETFIQYIHSKWESTLKEMYEAQNATTDEEVATEE